MTGGISEPTQLEANMVVGRQRQAAAQSLVSARQAKKVALDLNDLVHSMTEIVEQ